MPAVETRANLLQVSRCTCGDFRVTKDDFLCSATAESSHDSGHDLLFADQRWVFSRLEPSQTLGLSPGDQRHLLDLVMSWTASESQSSDVEMNVTVLYKVLELLKVQDSSCQQVYRSQSLE